MFLDLDFSIKSVEPTGQVEHTDLTDIDRAVGSFILGIVERFEITDRKRKENTEFVSFIERPRETKVYSGIFDSHTEFLQKLSSKVQKESKSDAGGEKVMERNNMLPVIYVGRDMTFSYNSTDGYVDQTWFQTLTGENEAGKTVEIGKLNKSYPRLTYNVNVLAWNKSTIARLATGITMWLRHTKKGRKHTFTARTEIAGIPVDLNVSVESARDITGFPVPIVMNEERLWGQTFAIEFTSEFLEVEAVSEKSIRVEVSGGLMP